MRYALLLTPLLPLALAACLTHGRLDHAATVGVSWPAVPMPGREYRLTAITDSGEVSSSAVVRAIDEPRIHVHPDGRWSVGVLGVWPLTEPLPKNWVWIIQPVTD
jgi:hypothetical protein